MTRLPMNSGDGYAPLKIVLELTSLSRSTLYREIARRRFPKPHKLSAGKVGWLRSEIEAWIARAPAHQEDRDGRP